MESEDGHRSHTKPGFMEDRRQLGQLRVPLFCRHLLGAHGSVHSPRPDLLRTLTCVFLPSSPGVIVKWKRRLPRAPAHFLPALHYGLPG